MRADPGAVEEDLAGVVGRDAQLGRARPSRALRTGSGRTALRPGRLQPACPRDTRSSSAPARRSSTGCTVAGVCAQFRQAFLQGVQLPQFGRQIRRGRAAGQPLGQVPRPGDLLGRPIAAAARPSPGTASRAPAPGPPPRQSASAFRAFELRPAARAGCPPAPVARKPRRSTTAQYVSEPTFACSSPSLYAFDRQRVFGEEGFGFGAGEDAFGGADRADATGAQALPQRRQPAGSSPARSPAM